MDPILGFIIGAVIVLVPYALVGIGIWLDLSIQIGLILRNL